VTCNLLGESIFLEIAEGRLRVREVYDIVFTPLQSVQGARLLCLSPHKLISGNTIRLSVARAPGAGAPEDIIYKKPLGCECNFDHISHRFSATVRETSNRLTQMTQSFSAEVIVPEKTVPSAINNKKALDILEGIGTIFELCLPNLQAGVQYIVRLLVEPEKLLGLSDLLPIDLESKVPIEWAQQASIICPKTCHYNICDLLTKARQSPLLADYAAAALALIDADNLRFIMPELHRILLILPAGCEMIGDDAVGCIWCSAIHQLPNYSLAVEWSGGTKHYWTDDVECVARRIWEHLRNWSQGNPKPTEFLTTALGIPHDNCALVANSLCRHNAFRLVDDVRGLFAANDLRDSDQASLFEKVALDSKVRASFRWMGFEIRYRVRFRYVSPAAKRQRKWATEVRPTLALLMSAIALVLSLALIVLKIWIFLK
jgi:hypothetical protein